MEPVPGAAKRRQVAHRALRHAPVHKPTAADTLWHPGVQRLHRMHLWRLPQQRRELPALFVCYCLLFLFMNGFIVLPFIHL